MSRPAVLYHGSPVLVQRLEPLRSAAEPHGAVFASHEPRSAIPFALPIRADERGDCSWSMIRDEAGPRITIHQGWLDVGAVGYLYEVSSELFEPVDAWQWICREAVAPIRHRAIAASEYVHWIVAPRRDSAS